jgi:hypothetical protein
LKNRPTGYCLEKILPLLALILLMAGLVKACSTAGTGKGAITFEEVSPATGIDYTGQSFGTSWGDYDSDGYMDVWLVNHLAPPVLYKNEAGKAFRDVTREVFGTDFVGLDWDTHAGTWADVNNDGAPDFYQCAGGLGGYSQGSSVSEANQLFIQREGKLEGVGPEYGLSYTKARSRTPLWTDLDRDGRLDMMLGLLARPDGTAPVGVFRQRENGYFEDAIEGFGIREKGADFITISDVTNDNTADVIMPVPGVPRGIQIYDGSTLPFRKVTDEWLPETRINVFDMALADLNGDALPDLYITAGYPVNSGVRHHDPNHITFGFQPAEGGEEGIRFKAGDSLKIELGYWPFLTGYNLVPDFIFLGENARNPFSAEVEMDPQYPDRTNAVMFRVSREEAAGLPLRTDTFGVYLGFDEKLQEWEIILKTPAMYNLTGKVNSEEPFTKVKPIGFEIDIRPLPDRLFLNTGSGFSEFTDGSGIASHDIAGVGVLAGDFDNDMDLDLYLVQTSHWGNPPNLLFENMGDAKFRLADWSTGAEGDTWGIGDTPSLADYDNDGFLDILLPNGKWPRMLEDDGRTQLFRNITGNRNHWIEIDLVGNISNRDGVGAKVYVMAGGKKQVRERGGMHRHSQDSPRLHFGLAGNRIIDEIEVIWPSGKVRRLRQIKADQVIRITEEEK